MQNSFYLKQTEATTEAKEVRVIWDEAFLLAPSSYYK